MPGAVALGAKTRQLRNIGLRRAGELLVEALGLWSLAHFTLRWASAFARLARLRGGLFAMVPRNFHLRLSRVLMNLETIVGGYIRGQALTSLFITSRGKA